MKQQVSRYSASLTQTKVNEGGDDVTACGIGQVGATSNLFEPLIF